MAKLKISRGTTHVRTLNYFKDGQPKSLVGCTVRFTMKKVESDQSADDSTAAIKMDIVNGVDQPGFADGIAVIRISPTDTALLEPTEYYYDILVDENTSPDAIYVVDSGTINLAGTVTNRQD